MATHDENTTTRARANLLREILYDKTNRNAFANKELYAILDLCLMCKGCKVECPSGIDMARYKTEFLQQYYDEHLMPLRTWLIANITRINRLGTMMPAMFNYFARNPFFSSVLKKTLGFAPKRSIPQIGKSTLKKWAQTFLKQMNGNGKTVYFFSDEFTNYIDVEIGKKALYLLAKLGYTIKITSISDSGRTYFSKGLVKKAKIIANNNIRKLSNIIKEQSPLIGIEPSAILSFRDEYPDIVNNELREKAKIIGKNALTVEEFLAEEFLQGNISTALFTSEPAKIKLHGHCHQKALSTTLPTRQILEIPSNYSVDEIPSGCCGMAGSFGFEKEHYDISMQVGELVLFPEIRKENYDIIAAPGTSCRQQIKDGTGKIALHPIEVLFNALV